LSAPDDPPGTQRELILPVHAEHVEISRRVNETRVRISLETLRHEHVVDEPVAGERVVVERIPVGRIVDAAPDIRHDGDTIILPVVEEILVTEKRLMLTEEVHIRRVRQTRRHTETVTLRTQAVTVTRDPPAADVAPSDDHSV
jgi:uncharacterized protein (TIGR02271 family)